VADSLVTRDYLAKLFGVDVRSIKNFVDEGMPKAKRGKYALEACVPWYLERERERVRQNKGLNDLDLARQRKTVAEARLAEIELETAEGQAIPLDLHISRMRERLESVAGAVKAIGRYQPAIKAAVTDEQADALCDRMSDEILAELNGLTDTID